MRAFYDRVDNVARFAASGLVPMLGRGCHGAKATPSHSGTGRKWPAAASASGTRILGGSPGWAAPP